MKITYDKALTNIVLDAFDKTINDEGSLVEKSDNTQKVMTRDGSEVNLSNFGGVKKGSEIFVSSNLVSMMDLCRYLATKSN